MVITFIFRCSVLSFIFRILPIKSQYLLWMWMSTPAAVLFRYQPHCTQEYNLHTLPALFLSFFFPGLYISISLSLRSSIIAWSRLLSDFLFQVAIRIMFFLFQRPYSFLGHVVNTLCWLSLSSVLWVFWIFMAGKLKPAGALLGCSIHPAVTPATI